MKYLLVVILCFYSFTSLAQDLASFGSSPVAFVENKGQIIDTDGRPRNDILFSLEGMGATIYLMKDRISTVQWYVEDKFAQDSEYASTSIGVEPQRGIGCDDCRPKTYGHRTDMVFEACLEAEVIAKEHGAEYRNYFFPHCPTGAVNVRSYQEIVYRGIYPQIDLRVYVYGNHYKYDFIVHPGGDPDLISLMIEGADEIEFDGDDIRLVSSIGTLKEHAPASFQDGVEVDCHYILDGRRITFEISDYSNDHTLTIDPVKEWATMYGGHSDEDANEVITDKDNNVLFCGGTNSIDFPVSAGAFQGENLSNRNLFLVKMNPDGFPVWSTYFGGSNYENGLCSIDVLSNNSIIMGAGIFSTDIPLTTYDHTPVPAWADNGIFRFTSGGMMEEGFVFGGESGESIWKLKAHTDNDFVIVGRTASDDYPVTEAAYQNERAGLDDIFVTSLSFEEISWSTFIGSSEDDEVCSLSINDSFLAFGGNTLGTDFPTSPDALMSELDGDFMGFFGVMNFDGEVEHLSLVADQNTGLGSLVCVGYFEEQLYLVTGSQSNQLFGIEADPNVDGVATQLAIISLAEDFSIQWINYLGGSGGDNVSAHYNSIDFDSDGNLYIPAITFSYDFPVSQCASQYFINDMDGIVQSLITRDIALVKCSPSGEILHTTFLGGSHVEGLADITVSDFNEVYVSTQTRGSFPTTAGAYMESQYGPEEFLAQGLDNDQCAITKYVQSSINLNVGSQNLCQGDEFEITFSSDSTFGPSNIFHVLLSDSLWSEINQIELVSIPSDEQDVSQQVSLPLDLEPGIYYLKVISSDPVIDFPVDIVTLVVADYTAPSMLEIPPRCEGDLTYLHPYAWPQLDGYFSGPGIAPFEPFYIDPYALDTGIHQLTYHVSNGCLTDSVNFEVSVHVPAPNVSLPNIIFCETDTIIQFEGGWPEGGYYWVNEPEYWEGTEISWPAESNNFFYGKTSGCDTSETSAQLIAIPEPEIIFPDYEAFCVEDGLISLLPIDPSWGTLVINETDTANWAYADSLGVGTFPLHYTYEDEYCGVVMDSTSFSIDSVPFVYFELPDIFCTNDEVYEFTVEPSGGTITPGFEDYVFDPAVLDPGFIMITYSYENGCGVFEHSEGVGLNLQPDPPEILQNNNTLFTEIQDGLQWYYNGIEIEGATGSFINVEDDGIYTATITVGPCESEMSNEINYVDIGTQELEKVEVLVFPNPSKNGKFTILMPWEGEKKVVVTDALGKTVDVRTIFSDRAELELRKPGFYNVLLTSTRLSTTQKLMVIKGD